MEGDVLTGAQFTTVAVLHRRLSIPMMLRHWVLTFLGNLAGSLFIVAIIAGYGGVFDAPAYANEVRAFVTAKQVTPMWHQVFLKGIGANWLVCLACYLGLSGREYASKIVGIWWPTFAFISLGFDHGKVAQVAYFVGSLLIRNSCCKHVYRAHGDLGQYARSQRWVVCLERCDSGLSW